MAKAPVKKAAAAKKAPAKKPAAEKKVPAKSAEKAPTTDGGSGGVKIVSNKVCQAFKTRAEGLKKAILAAKPQASVEIEEQKPLGRNPDKGTFAVSVMGKVLVEKVAMPRPFTAMKALDMDALAKQVIAAL